MSLFPTNAIDGEVYAADNGKNYVYQSKKNVWQSTDCVPKWSDQVYIRGIENKTQQNVNDTNQEVNVKVGNVATATNQLLDVAFDVRCRGIWIYQGGAVAPGDPPVGLQRFLMSDKDGAKTQEYSDAASLTIHAIGAGQLDKISIGETEVGDLITIQNSSDLGGGSYIVTAIEEFHNDNPDELTETYAVYTVVADTKRCSGSIATEEKAVIRIIPQQAVPALEDEYLPISGGTLNGDLAMSGHKVTGLGDCTADAQAANKRYVDGKTEDALLKSKANDVTTGFRLKNDGKTLISTATAGKLKLYHVVDPTDAEHAVNKQYADSVTTERFYTFRNIGDSGALYAKAITYSTEHGGQLTIPCKALSGPCIGNGDTYFGFRSWTGQMSLAVETEPGTWQTILMGVTSEIRYSTSASSTFYEVKVPAEGLIVNTPNTEYNELKCRLKIAGLF